MAHITDLHLNVRFPDRAVQLAQQLYDMQQIFKPKFVVATGDLTDAKLADNSSLQHHSEWKLYKTILQTFDYHNNSRWIDMRGNHDCFHVANYSSSSASYFRNYSVASTHAQPHQPLPYTFIWDQSSEKHQLITSSSTDPTTSSLSPQINASSSIRVVAYDSCHSVGNGSPLNFFGYARQDNLDILERHLASRDDFLHTFVVGHYPIATIQSERSSLSQRSFKDLLLDHKVTGYLCGHLHTFFDLMPSMFVRHTNDPSSHQLLELETADWKYNRQFHLIGFKRSGIFSLSNVHFNQWPAVLLMNPKPASLLSPYEPVSSIKSRSFIEFVVFSLDPIIEADAFINGHSVGSSKVDVAGLQEARKSTKELRAYCHAQIEEQLGLIDKTNNFLDAEDLKVLIDGIRLDKRCVDFSSPLFAPQTIRIPYNPDLFSTGLHELTLLITDDQGEIHSETNVFSLDGHTSPFAFLPKLLLTSRIDLILRALCIFIILFFSTLLFFTPKISSWIKSYTPRDTNVLKALLAISCKTIGTKFDLLADRNPQSPNNQLRKGLFFFWTYSFFGPWFFGLIATPDVYGFFWIWGILYIPQDLSLDFRFYPTLDTFLTCLSILILSLIPCTFFSILSLAPITPSSMQKRPHKTQTGFSLRAWCVINIIARVVLSVYSVRFVFRSFLHFSRSYGLITALLTPLPSWMVFFSIFHILCSNYRSIRLSLTDLSLSFSKP